MGAYEHPDGEIRSYGGPGASWRGDLWPDPKPQSVSPSYAPPAAPQTNWNLNTPAGQNSSSSGAGFALECWHLLFFPFTWPFFLAGGLIWLAFKAFVGIVRLAFKYRKAIAVVSLVSASIAFLWGTIHVRGLAAYEDGFPLDASTSTRISMAVGGQQGMQPVDVYNKDNFGAGFYRSFCSLVGAPHHYYFSSPAIVNHAAIENERITGWKLFKVNGGSVRDSKIVVRHGEIVIAGSVTHCTLVAEKIIVKGKVSRNSRLIILKPDPLFAPYRVKDSSRHKAAH